MLSLSNLKPAQGTKKRKRVARGTATGWGKTAGRGSNGQNSRSGGGVRVGFEGGQMPLFRRLPKRGFNNSVFEKKYTTINIDRLNDFNDGDVIDSQMLQNNGVIKKIEKDGIKILGDGQITKKLTVKASKFTKSAIEKIEKAGGKAEVI